MAQLTQLPRFVLDLLAACPSAGAGVHNHLFRLARVLHPFYAYKAEMAALIAASVAGCGRDVPASEIEHAERKWRADFAHIESRTLIEIEGGLWIQGRHNRPQGFAADAEKYLEAAMAGWRVLRLTELQITAPMIERIVVFIRTAGVKSV